MKSASQKIIKTAPLERIRFIGMWPPWLCLPYCSKAGTLKATIRGTIVAQEFPISASVIYDTLSSDVPLVQDYLGTYKFRAGQTASAISIVSPGEDLPALREVEGVECIIQDVGEFSKNEYLSGDAARLTVTWSVFLVCWENARGADMQVAAERICSRFLGSQAIQTVATSDGLGALVQMKILIRSDMPILAA